MAAWSLLSVIAGAMLLAATLGGYFVGIQIALLFFLAWPRAYRWLATRTVGLWSRHVAFLPELFFNVRYQIVGDRVLCGEPALVISNHPSLSDFLFLSKFASLAGCSSSFAIVLKDSLKHVPVFGYALQAAQYISLCRANKDEDKRGLQTAVAFAQEHRNGDPYMLLMFPEGTDASPVHIAKSQAWAGEHGQPRYNNVLHPRPVGFAVVAEAMAAHCKYVYDITLQYVDAAGVKVVPSPSELLAGRLPHTVCMHVKRHALADVTRDTPAAWLKARFQEKEQALAVRSTPTSASFASDDHMAAAQATLALLGMFAVVMAWCVWLPVSTISFLVASAAFGKGITTLHGGLELVEQRVRALPWLVQWFLQAASMLALLAGLARLEWAVLHALHLLAIFSLAFLLPRST